MGHVNWELDPGEGLEATTGGSASAHDPGGGQRRAVEAVRRGAVRERRVGARVTAPSRWEHVEVEMHSAREGVSERVASLELAADGCFEAAIRGDSGAAFVKASGTWRHCFKGIELVFEANLNLDLPEHVVVYHLSRDCLVADYPGLPDGLAQEYSLCDAAPPTGASSLVQMQRRAITAGVPEGSVEVVKTATVEVASDDSEQETGLMPFGIIEEGDSGGDDDFDGFDFQPAAIAKLTSSTSSKKHVKDDAAAGEEEYADDFEGDSD